jgi:hypothetical protein
MNSELYIIVTKERDIIGDVNMVVRNTPKEVIAYVSTVSTANIIDLDVSVERIFSVSDRGKVVYYEVAFTKGKFCLEAQPEVC